MVFVIVIYNSNYNKITTFWLVGWLVGLAAGEQASGQTGNWYVRFLPLTLYLSECVFVCVISFNSLKIHKSALENWIASDRRMRMCLCVCAFHTIV